MSDGSAGTTAFRSGLAGRHAAAAAALDVALARLSGFAPRDLTAPQPIGGPRHFSPADRDTNPTAGWNPLDPEAHGFVDPIAAARAEGHAAGVAQADADHARDRAFAAALGDALGTGIDRERLAERLRQTVVLLVTRLVGEVGVSPERLAARIDVAVAMLDDPGDGARLRVHPDDLPLLDGRLPPALVAVGDVQIARGGFVLDGAATMVEDGPDHWLDSLAAAIDHVALPPC